MSLENLKKRKFDENLKRKPGDELENPTKKQKVEEEEQKEEPCILLMFHCVECYAYLGEENPRQLCLKTYCEDFDMSSTYHELLERQLINLKYSPYYCDKTSPGYSESHGKIKTFIEKHRES